jgi:FtsP/CotA-like multicopper oxidase with cupredoxin domain
LFSADFHVSILRRRRAQLLPTRDRVFHCHILEHEDKGMMATIGVVDGRERR